MLQYFLAPTRDTPPETFIRLGNIIEQPRFADRPLNRHPLPPEDTIVGPEMRNHVFEFDNIKVYTIGIWTSFLMQILGIGGDVNTQIAKGTAETWDCERIETVSFEPTSQYIEQSLDSTNVKRYIQDNKNWLWDTKLHMITGIKIAYGAKGTIRHARSKGIHLHLGVDAILGFTPVQAGPDIGVEKGRNVTQDIGDKDPFVLAFRMQRIKVSSKGQVRHERVDGGMLGVEDDDSEAEEERVELVVDGLESADANAEEFGVGTSWKVGDEGAEEMICALVEDD
ncbi:unnamed protein product [Alternaria alternata]